LCPAGAAESEIRLIGWLLEDPDKSAQILRQIKYFNYISSLE
jgi:hypothetical protein